MTGRELALVVLTRVEQDAAWASRALDGELERTRLPARERGLATEIVYGVLRQRQRLDRALRSMSNRGLDGLDPVTRTALRVGAYQILLLSRVPDFAAVDQAVTWIARRRGAKLAGLVNALLRRLAREGEPPVPSIDEDPHAHLEWLSVPSWLARRLLDQLDAHNAVLWGGSQLEASRVTLRTNTIRIDRNALLDQLASAFPEGTFEPGRFAPECITVRGAGAPHRWKLYEDGCFSVQDEAAQLVAHVVEPGKVERVLDACCGVGTKSTHLAALMRNQGRVDAIDTNARRVALARAASLRLGASSIRVERADLLEWQQEPYDAVLLDAPCSGLGVLRHHPETKWRTSAPDFAAHMALQLRLCEAASRHVRRGGVLVYAVCTFDRDETDRVVHEFLARHSDFRCESSPNQRAVLTTIMEREGVYRTWTHRDGTDTFFMARLRRY